MAMLFKCGKQRKIFKEHTEKIQSTKFFLLLPSLTIYKIRIKWNRKGELRHRGKETALASAPLEIQLHFSQVLST